MAQLDDGTYINHNPIPFLEENNNTAPLQMGIVFLAC